MCRVLHVRRYQMHSGAGETTTSSVTTVTGLCARSLWMVATSGVLLHAHTNASKFGTLIGSGCSCQRSLQRPQISWWFLHSHLTDFLIWVGVNNNSVWLALWSKVDITKSYVSST